MFKKKKARVVVTPQFLEALTPKKETIEIVGIQFVYVESQYQEFLLGTVIDYDGKEYDFEWDRKKQNLAKLSGEEMNPIVWQIASEELNKFFQPRIETKVEPRVEVPKIEQIEKIVEAVVERQPSIHEEMEMETEEDFSPITEEGVDFSDDEIFANAQKFLQESR